VACTAIDGSKPYYPKTDTIMDIPTAHTFFAQDANRTKRRLTEKAKRLCDKWNEKFYDQGLRRQVKKLFS